MKQATEWKMAFNKRGALPPGIHEFTLDELRELVAVNPERLVLWRQLITFLSWAVLVPHFSNLYLAGGFVSAKGKPRDIDVILQPTESFGPDSFAAVERFFVFGLDSIRDMYSVDLHFWMDGAPDSVADYRTFFQYERAKAGPRRRECSKGIAKVSLQTSEITQVIRRHLHPGYVETKSKPSTNIRRPCVSKKLLR